MCSRQRTEVSGFDPTIFDYPMPGKRPRSEGYTSSWGRIPTVAVSVLTNSTRPAFQSKSKMPVMRRLARRVFMLYSAVSAVLCVAL